MTEKTQHTGEKPEPMFYRQHEVATLVGLSGGEVRRAIRDGKLKARRYGKRSVLIAPEDMKAWIEAETTVIERVA